ncbi:Cysteine-rich secretory protein 2 [Labeo rohita]|uniref:Cysteine-rich secretory protein 2 n=1 Tax=Labeo rohita TaxID=84645 RepID=A0ABQ8LW65_LABRO|nr:Cysteine-rich secretory protein 2 [Labeo rohita]
MFAVTVCVCTDLTSVQQEIVDVHNAYRRAVVPSASNMLKMGSADYSWTDVVNAWHSEVNNYKYPTGSTNGQPIGHYTQVVWYSSYEVGCAVAQCGSSYFYGCHYYRAGNFRRVSPYSLGDPCASCPDDCEDGLCTNPCPYIDMLSNCDKLKKMATCDHSFVSKLCQASCLCEDKIVPVARK